MARRPSHRPRHPRLILRLVQTLDPTTDEPATSSRHRFALALGGIGIAALVIRVVWVLVARRDFALKGDDFYYHWQANALADGLGFINPLTWKALDRLDPSAAHPPLYSLYLAVVSSFGGTSALAHRLASCVLGAGGVVVIGLVARRIAGHRAGLLAASIAAVYPMLWINDGMLVSESMYVLVVAAILLAAYRLWDTRRLLDAVLLGAAIGLGALTRPEAIMLVPLIGLPLLLAKDTDLRARAVTVLAVGGACLVVILPWWVRNLTTFEEPVFLATGHGSVLQIANCDTTYSGPLLGYWDIRCLTDARPPQNEEQRRLLESNEFPGIAYLLLQDPRDESVPDVQARERAFDYIGDHLSRAPVVAAARVGRVLGFYRIEQGVDFDVFFERRGRWPSWLGTGMYYALLAFSVYALVTMRRRRVPISPLIAIAVMVVVTAAISIGITRYRVGGDVALAVLGGVGIDALWRRFREHHADTSVEPPLVAS
jgi:4-amino-4-deoxy-L-arabinose transferase-like glycosyltransferase